MPEAAAAKTPRAPIEDEVSLERLCNGGLAERFGDAMAQLVENVLDPNTEWKANRKLTIEITIQPLSEDRNQTSTRVRINTKLAPTKDLSATLYMGMQDGRPIAVSYDMRQSDLFRAPAISPAVQEAAS